MVQSIGLNYIKHAYNLYDPVHGLEEANHFLDLAKENHCQLTDYARRQGGRNDSYNLIIGGFVNRITERHA